MCTQLDAGDIYLQEPLSLHGQLNEIFYKITKLGIDMTLKITKRDYIPRSQDDSNATYCKRRSPEESEIFLKDFEIFSAIEMHDKIRMLSYEGYPSAFINMPSGGKLYLHESSID